MMNSMNRHHLKCCVFERNVTEKRFLSGEDRGKLFSSRDWTSRHAVSTLVASY